MYSEIQSEVHGPEYLLLAATAAAAKSKERAVANAAARAAANAALPNLAAATALDPTTGLEQISSCDAAGDLPQIQEGIMHEGIFYPGYEIPQQDWLESQLVERFPLNAPRTSTSSENGESPDRLFRRPETQEILDEDAATHTEASEEEGVRLRRMSAKLRTLEGNDHRGVNFILRVGL